MSRRTKRYIRRIIKSINKHMLAMCYMFMLCVGVLGLGKLVYESGILLILDMVLSTIFA